MNTEKIELRYTLNEVAAAWSVSREQLLRMATNGELTISALISGRFIYTVRTGESGVTHSTPPYESEELVTIPPEDAIKFLTMAKVPVSYFSDHKGNEYLPFPPGQHKEYGIEELCITSKEFSRVDTVLKTNAPNLKKQDNIGGGWRTGDKQLCDAFGVKHTSISAVYRQVKKAEKKFDYDPITGEKRLQLATINEILAQKGKKSKKE